MTKTLDAIINDESIEGAVMMSGDFREFVLWNTILALYDLEPIR